MADWAGSRQGASGQEEVSEKTAGERKTKNKRPTESGEGSCEKEESQLTSYYEDAGTESFFHLLTLMEENFT